MHRSVASNSPLALTPDKSGSLLIDDPAGTLLRFGSDILFESAIFLSFRDDASVLLKLHAPLWYTASIL